MEYENSRYQDQESGEEYEETISLSDFPLITSDEHDQHVVIEDELRTCQDLQSVTERSENFEFSRCPDSIMSHAEDIINCGRLMPFKEQDQVSRNLYGRRCLSEPLPDLKIGGYQSNSSNRKMRNSRSLDFRKLSRNSSASSDSPDSYQNNSSSTRFDSSNIKIPKPRWYILMFGIGKFPTEMDLQDIKNRQVHRIPTKPLFPGIQVVEKAPAKRRSSWGVLEVLSCRGDTSVNVTASLACIPQVR